MHGGTSTAPRTPEGLRRIVKGPHRAWRLRSRDAGAAQAEAGPSPRRGVHAVACTVRPSSSIMWARMTNF
jgi:hypothetical protein